jgi:alcohol dehydrogenase, propanol-preferring
VGPAGTACPGGETLCESQVNSGYSIDGAYAEYALAYANGIVHVPDGVSSVDAAPLTCAGVTTYKAIKVAKVVPAERVAVFGIGGLGHMAVQYARIVGGLVTAVDIEQGKLELAEELGADHLVNAATTDPVEAIQAVGGADVAVVLAASPKPFEQAYRSLRRGGRLVMVALPADNAAISVPIFNTVLAGISVIGSIVGTRQDLAEVFALHAAGRTKVIAETRDLDQVNECFDEVLGGKVPARLVFRF